MQHGKTAFLPMLYGTTLPKFNTPTVACLNLSSSQRQAHTSSAVVQPDESDFMLPLTSPILKYTPCLINKTGTSPSLSSQIVVFPNFQVLIHRLPTFTDTQQIHECPDLIIKSSYER